MFYRKSEAFSVQRERLRAVNCPCHFISKHQGGAGLGAEKTTHRAQITSETLYLSPSLIGREGTVKCCRSRQSRSGIPIIIWGEGGYCRFPFAVSAGCGKLRSSSGLCILTLAAHAGGLCTPRACKRNKKKSTSDIVIVAFFLIGFQQTNFLFHRTSKFFKKVPERQPSSSCCSRPLNAQKWE